jgi:hypothetical protein
MPQQRGQQHLSHNRRSRLGRVILSAAALLLPCLLLAALAGTRAAAQEAAAAAAPDLTQLSMTGEQGDYIGGPVTYSYKPEDGTFGVSASDRTGDGQPDYLTVSFNGLGTNGHWWYLNFGTDRTGKNLVPGLYTNAERAPFASAGHPGMDIFGDGRGCNTVAGTFRIHEIETDPLTPTKILRFTASFEQHCEGGPAALLGTIYYNYSGSAPTHSISGRLAEGNGTAAAGVQVALNGSQTATTTTDPNGNYSFPNLIEGGNFRVVPAQGANYVVSPQATAVTNLSADSTVNFTTVPLYSISGTVKNSAGAAITGAAVALSGSATRTVSTDNNGAYSFTGLRADGNYVVTPSRTHYGFTPPSRSFNTLSGNTAADFVGALLTHTISGRVIDNLGVGVSGATVNLSGTVASTTTTDANGNYSFTNLTAGGNYSLTPVMKYLTFSPPSANFFDLSGNWGNINFTGTRATYALSGVVLDNNGNPLGGVLLTLGGTRAGTTVTNASGNYSFTALPAGGNYTVGAAKWNYVFSPAARDTNDLSENRTLNYVGTQDAAQFFVRQHYADFLGREPDASGLAFWTNQMTNCATPPPADPLVCRVNVSAAFFLSIEFQNTGYLVERVYKVAYGDVTEGSTGLVVPVIRRDEFTQDTPLISANVVVGEGDWQGTLNANKTAYAQTFVQRKRFTDIYGALGPAQFVDKLNQNAGGVLTDAEKAALVNELTANNTVAGRASVLRQVAENAELDRREKSRAFVLMEYFGYLRRNPSDAPEPGLNFNGWNFWLGKLNEFNGNYVAAEMVKAFITSDEYRKRFGQ